MIPLDNMGPVDDTTTGLGVVVVIDGLAVDVVVVVIIGLVVLTNGCCVTAVVGVDEGLLKKEFLKVVIHFEF